MLVWLILEGLEKSPEEKGIQGSVSKNIYIIFILTEIFRVLKLDFDTKRQSLNIWLKKKKSRFLLLCSDE